MKRKKVLVWLLAIVILLICWGINLSTRTTQGITGATVIPEKAMGVAGYVQITVLVLFFLSALLIQKYPKPYLRYGILIFAVLFLGFYKKEMLTTGYILNLITGRWWPLAGHIFLYTLFFLILITSLLGRDTYCCYCCPFGAIQQLIYKISPFKLGFSPHLTGVFRGFRYIFLWLVLVVALVLDDFRIAGLDPYTTMFSGKGDWPGWLQLGLILGFSLLYYRIWCSHFCPVGAAVSVMGSIPGLRQVLGRKTVSIGKTGWKEMFKKHTTYIFLIVFLLLLVVTLAIIALSLKRQVHQSPPAVVPPPGVGTTAAIVKEEVREPLQQPSAPQQPSAAEEFFIKYGIKPRKAMYYE